ncbi:MAG: hypothetical protein LWY06_04900 [Firmicutes bacterium]|nr:hypothetical protein [Bacillota bacterium]
MSDSYRIPADVMKFESGVQTGVVKFNNMDEIVTQTEVYGLNTSCCGKNKITADPTSRMQIVIKQCNDGKKGIEIIDKDGIPNLQMDVDDEGTITISNPGKKGLAGKVTFPKALENKDDIKKLKEALSKSACDGDRIHAVNIDSDGNYSLDCLRIMRIIRQSGESSG